MYLNTSHLSYHITNSTKNSIQFGIYPTQLTNNFTLVIGSRSSVAQITGFEIEASITTIEKIMLFFGLYNATLPYHRGHTNIVVS